MIRTVTLTLGLLFTSLSLSIAQISVVIDPPPISTILDNFNDGIDTTTAFANASSAGEAGGVASVSVAADVPDPQFQVPTPGDPFDISVHPFLRLSSRGTVGVGAQVFPLPPSGVTVVDFNTETNFAESAMTFVADPPGASGDGLRIDPIPNGGAATDTFDYDYIILDKFQTHRQPSGQRSHQHPDRNDQWK